MQRLCVNSIPAAFRRQGELVILQCGGSWKRREQRKRGSRSGGVTEKPENERTGPERGMGIGERQREQERAEKGISAPAESSGEVVGSGFYLGRRKRVRER